MGYTAFQAVVPCFYERYPSTQYEIVAYERVLNWIPAASAVGAGLLGLGFSMWASFFEKPEEVPIGIGITVGLTGAGFLGGLPFGIDYLVTYVERAGALPALRTE